MKAVLIASVLLVALVLSIPLIFVAPSLDIPTPSPPAPSETAAATPQITITIPKPPPFETVQAPAPEVADRAVIALSRRGEIISLSMKDYLAGVVAAEMPASFNLEALKAQAVAARTYALYKISKKYHSREGFDLCDDYGCCSAYLGLTELKEKWGGEYERYIAKIRSAVEATDGLYLTWAGEPILAVFHSSSYGKTEGSENVWISPLPYLVPVNSPETPERVSNLLSTVAISAEDFRATVLGKYPGASLSGEPGRWISDLTYTESGRVKSLKVGGVIISGSDFRFLFGLRSTAFSFEYDGEAFVFSVAGFGHGVGMSQYGANLLAEDGAAFDEILANYYPGTELARFSGSFPS